MSRGESPRSKEVVDRPRYKRPERSLSKGLTLRTTPQTSARMGRIRQRDTALELTVRKVAWRLGLRFTSRNRDLPGSPDLANRSRRLAVFCMGCFWHHHARCRRATVPKSNRLFWLRKFERNRERDAAARKALRALGYSVVDVWECEAEHLEKIELRLSSLMRVGGTPSGRA